MQAQLKGRYFVTLKARPNGQDIVFQFYLRPRKKDVFHEIHFCGLNRVPEKSLVRLAHLPGSATYSNLIHAQKRILDAGQFYGVQLITKGQTATFKLQERNRFDLSLGVNYSEKDAYGSSIQLMDRMFLRRPNDLVLRFETGREKDQLLSRIVLRNFLKSPGNLIMFGQWWKEKNSLSVRIPDGWGGYEVSVDLITNQKYALEYEIPLSDTQDLNFGGEFILARTDTTVKYLDDLEEEWQDPETFSNLNTFFPLNLSWSLKSFDRNNNPRNGLLSTASLSYFIPAFSEDDIGGTRWAVGATLYKSFSRWTGVHRIKTGIYDPSDEDFLGLGEDNPTKFYLGGSTSLRGYRANTVGPYDPEQEEGLGGNAMLFLSEEWAYHTGYYGFSLAGFVDAGQIWKSKDDITMSDIKYSAGLGIIFDSPAGLFRVDYAVPLDEENDEIIENWTLKFGAVF
jgi:outer membrane protein assembly factor BamA